jgi:pyruvate kinase
MKKTKIVCTIGPATKDVEVLKEMMLEGMNVARINFSHGSYEDQKVYVEAIKKAREEVNLPVALLLDTQGPEIRTGKLENDSVELKTGNKIILTNKEVLGNEDKIFMNFEDLYKDVKQGTIILVDDGKIELVVDKIENEDIFCTITNGGKLGNRKSINLPGTEVNLPALKEKDVQDLKDGCKAGFDYVSASFVRTANDVKEIRKVLDENGGEDIKIISKIENRQGMDNIEEIVKISDGIMVARGDLGVEVPLEEVPLMQKRMIKLCNKYGKIVITATQMLESMTTNPRPTRAEVSDVANAIYDGTGAIMLSGESAMGKYPVECVKTMSKIANTVERDIDYWKNFDSNEYDADNPNYEFNINHSICLTAKEMRAKAFVAYTEGGDTPRTIASFLPECPIYAITANERTYRQMALGWGIIPILIHADVNAKELISMGIEQLKEDGILIKGDIIAIAGGNLIVENSKDVINRTIGGVLRI